MRLHRVLSLFAALLALSSASAQAQYTQNIHVAPSDDSAAQRCGRMAADALVQSGRYIERMSAEQVRVVSDCVEEVASPAAAAECDLALATAQVDLVLIPSAESLGASVHYGLRIHSTALGAQVWSDTRVVPSGDLEAALDTCAGFGRAYLGADGVGAPSTPSLPSTDASNTGRVEVLAPTPSVIRVLVDGVEAGVSNQQLVVRPGVRVVELQAPGYEAWRSEVNVEPGEVVSLTGVALEPIPTTVVVRTNVAGADCVASDTVLATTNIDGWATFELRPGTWTIELRRAGYEVQRLRMEATPGGRVDEAVELVAATVSARQIAGREYVRVEPGQFEMGSPGREYGRDRDERQREVTLTRPFLVQTTEVTRAQWRAVMGTDPSGRGCESCPVDRVSWWDAIAYLNTLSRLNGLEACYVPRGCTGTPGTGCPEGYGYCESDFTCADAGFVGLDCAGYRLLTEAEWEYAARDAPGLDEPTEPLNVEELRGWHTHNANGGPREVAQYPASALGLFDMAGNVAEWVSDVYVESPERESVDPHATGDGSRVIRGGAWDDTIEELRPAARARAGAESRRDNTGFRVGRTVVVSE